MRVGVVAYEMEGASTGVGRYLAGLLDGLRQVADPAWSFVLFTRRQLAIDSVGAGSFELLQPRRTIHRPIVFEQLAVPRLAQQAAVDVVFSPSYGLPRCGGRPAVVTIHDLSFERLPEEFGLKERWRRRWLARRAARHARRVLADREAVRAELEERYRLPASRIGVVPLAVDARFGPEQAAEDEQQLERLGVEPPYLLQVGTVLERRCPELVLEVFGRLLGEDPALRLVIAGANRLRRPQRLAEAIAELPHAARVTMLGYAPEEALPALYRGARATLYLSRYEGYGLPPLESLACGTPAVTAPGLALDEVWPGYPFRASSLEVENVLARARAALRADRGELQRLAEERLGTLSWERSARQLLLELEQAAR